MRKLTFGFMIGYLITSFFTLSFPPFWVWLIFTFITFGLISFKWAIHKMDTDPFPDEFWFKGD